MVSVKDMPLLQDGSATSPSNHHSSTLAQPLLLRITAANPSLRLIRNPDSTAGTSSSGTCKPMDAEDCEDYTDVFFIMFAQVSDARCKPMDAEDCEDYTDVLFIKFAQVSDAR
ncbi:hypothetical protein ZWY2020_026176 [Hordeum vulgare]|nr:hypothetical protein ZWY2020_026176 [Hordeum vulgare]